MYIVFRRLLGPADPSFRALSRRLKFTVRCHKSNKDSLSPNLGHPRYYDGPFGCRGLVLGGGVFLMSEEKGYLAHKKLPPPQDHRRVLGIGVL